MKKIIFVGYMGCGKTFFAKEVSRKIEKIVYDLDELIENELQMTVNSIFSQKGELFFRKKEHAIFKEKMQSKESFIMSTGGGTPCYFNNHEYLVQNDCVSFYLKASITTLYERLQMDKSKRPLLSNLNENKFKEYIAKHLFERSFYYNKANYVIDIDAKSTDEIVYEVLEKLS
jgi:shikimate kinase